MTKWIYLMFVLIVSGCSVSRGEHQKVLDQLACEKKEHGITKKKLAEVDACFVSEKEKHGITKKKLAEVDACFVSEKKEHQTTQQKLTEVDAWFVSEKKEHGITQQKLAEVDAWFVSEKKEHGITQQKLDLEKGEHRITEQKLTTVNGKYEKLLHTRSLTVDEYFSLGSALVELGIKEEGTGRGEEAEKLFKRAVVPLEKILDHRPSADTHYYLSRAYYGIGNFKKARAEAKEAVRLAKGNHPRAQEILNATVD